MIIIFLIKLRLSIFDEDIGYNFCIHCVTVERYFHKTLDVMDMKLLHLLKWLDHQNLTRKFLKFFQNIL